MVKHSPQSLTQVLEVIFTALSRLFAYGAQPRPRPTEVLLDEYRFLVVLFLSFFLTPFFPLSPCLSPFLCLEQMDNKSCLNDLSVLSLDPGSANGDRLCKPR